MTTRNRTLLAGLALAAAAIALPSRADDPGPGGERPPTPKNAKEIYVFYCQACHMADGKGATGAATFPSLVNNPRLGTAAYPISVIERGKGGMPWFRDILKPAQVAELVAYLRTNYGNNYPQPVTEADVLPFVKPTSGGGGR